MNFRLFVCLCICLFVHLSIYPSVRPSFHPLRLRKTAFSGCFWPHTESNNRQTCLESLLFYSVVLSACSSICLSILCHMFIANVTWRHMETQSGRIVAWSGLYVIQVTLSVHTSVHLFIQRSVCLCKATPKEFCVVIDFSF